MTTLDENAWNTLLHNGRTHSAWQDRPVEDALLVKLYELLRLAPTAMNCQSARVVFVKSAEAKERLKPALDGGNVDKTMQAPVTAIVAFDTDFHEHLPALFPHWAVAKDVVAGFPEEGRHRMAFLNATLQAGYLITTARGLGLDCGPMGGFNAQAVDEAFFPEGRVKSFLLVNLGYGDADKLFPRNPRLAFEQACQIA